MNSLARVLHAATSPAPGYLPLAARNLWIPQRAAWSYSDLPNLARSGTSSIPWLVLFTGFLKQSAHDKNEIFVGTF